MRNGNWEKPVAITLAVASFATAIALAFASPSLTSFQTWLLRLIAAIGAGLSAGLFAGSISVTGSYRGLAIRATAGFVVFLAVYFFSPGQFDEEWFGLGPPPTRDEPEDIHGAEGISLPTTNLLFLDHTGRETDISQDDYRFKVVTFSYSRTPCKRAIATASALVEILSPYIPIGAYVVTIDPDRDTVEESRRFVAGHGYKFSMLVGSKESIKSFAKSLKVFYIERLQSSGVDFEYTNTVYVFESNRPFLAARSWTSPALVAKRILNQARKSSTGISPPSAQIKLVGFGNFTDDRATKMAPDSELAKAVDKEVLRLAETDC